MNSNTQQTPPPRPATQWPFHVPVEIKDLDLEDVLDVIIENEKEKPTCH
jgi:hypothetical protein